MLGLLSPGPRLAAQENLQCLGRGLAGGPVPAAAALDPGLFEEAVPDFEGLAEAFEQRRRPAQQRDGRVVVAARGEEAGFGAVQPSGGADAARPVADHDAGRADHLRGPFGVAEGRESLREVASG